MYCEALPQTSHNDFAMAGLERPDAIGYGTVTPCHQKQHPIRRYQSGQSKTDSSNDEKVQAQLAYDVRTNSKSYASYYDSVKMSEE
jgi:hypothetical protein